MAKDECARIGWDIYKELVIFLPLVVVGLLISLALPTFIAFIFLTHTTPGPFHSKSSTLIYNDKIKV